MIFWIYDTPCSVVLLIGFYIALDGCIYPCGVWKERVG